MALIPSESYSFPDDFVQTIADARKSARQPVMPHPGPSTEAGPDKLVAKGQEPTVAEQLFAAVEPANGSVDNDLEVKPKRHSLRNLIPSTLKKRIDLEKPSVLPEERAGNGSADFWSINVEPIVQPDVAPFHPIEQLQAPAEVPIDFPIAPAETPEMRVIDSPSADLVQTLLARALFGSTTESAQIPPPPQNGVTPFQENVEPVTNGDFGMVEAPSIFTPFTPELAQEPSSAVPQKPAAPLEERPSVAFLPIVSDESLGRPVPKAPRSAKVRRFLKYEAIALGVLIPLAILGLLRLFHDPIVVLIIDATTIAAAFAAALMPIFFFAAAPQLPRGEE